MKGQAPPFLETRSQEATAPCLSLTDCFNGEKKNPNAPKGANE